MANLNLFSGEEEQQLFLHSDVPLWEPPPNFTKVPLREHQRRGVKWMLDREKESSGFTKGGIVMDEAGLGKTLQTLALIKASGPITDSYTLQKKPTLIICPSSLIGVWQEEIETKFDIDTFKVNYYYKSERKNADISKWMNESDIIITSYAILAREWEETDFAIDSIFRRLFGRIILDEAHHIRNRETITSRAAMQLLGYRCWCLTATPVHNKINDLFPLFSFMSIHPFVNDYRQWNAYIVNTLQRNTKLGMERLFSFLVPISIRRTKQLLNLPQIHIHNVPVKLSPIEEDFYYALFYYSRERVKKILQFMEQLKLKRSFQTKEERAADKDNRSRIANTSCLILILRLRQACVNPGLVIQSMQRLDENSEYNEEIQIEKKLEDLPTTEEVQRCVEKLRQLMIPGSDENECLICMDNVAKHAAIPCNHICCENCWTKLFDNNLRFCPHCRCNITGHILISDRIKQLENTETERKELLSEKENLVKQSKIILDSEKTFESCSSKIDWTIQFLQNQTEKVMIFSQWVQVLDILANAIQKRIPGKKFCRLDGRICPCDRMKIVHQFQQDPSIRICLSSLSSSSEGITMTAATKVIHMDPWWNKSKEEQASDRIHRIGQTKDIDIYRLHALDTIEDHILLMRKRKKKISKLAVGTVKNIEEMPWINKVRLMFNLDEEDVAMKRRKQSEWGEDYLPKISIPTNPENSESQLREERPPPDQSERD